MLVCLKSSCRKTRILLEMNCLFLCYLVGKSSCSAFSSPEKYWTWMHCLRKLFFFRLFKISSRQVFMGAIIFLLFFNLHNLKQTHLNLAGLVNSILAATSKMRKNRKEKKRFGKLASVFYCENHSGNLYKIRRSWLWALVDLGAYTGNRAHLTEDSTLQETPSCFTFLY